MGTVTGSKDLLASFLLLDKVCMPPSMQPASCRREAMFSFKTEALEVLFILLSALDIEFHVKVYHQLWTFKFKTSPKLQWAVFHTAKPLLKQLLTQSSITRASLERKRNIWKSIDKVTMLLLIMAYVYVTHN